MNKKITTIILALILLLSVMTSIIAATSLQIEPTATVTIPDKYSSEKYTQNESADKTKKITVLEANYSMTEKTVTYSATKKVSDNYTIDIYTDTVSNEYMYSTSDELLGYKRHNKTMDEFLYPEKFTDRLQDKNEKKAIAYAEKFASDFLGNEFDDFVFEEVKMLGSDIYFVMFELPAGKDGFIHVRRCTVCINSDGFIDSCILSKKVYNNRSDLEIIDNISKEDVLSNITKQLTDLFSDAREINLQKVYLKDGMNSLHIQAEFTTDLDITEKIDGHDFGFIDDNSYFIILSYPLS